MNHCTSSYIQLANLTTRLIRACEMPAEQANLVAELRQFFIAQTGFHPPDTPPVETAGTQLKTGLALSPSSASLCLSDATRTVRFITGIYRTIHQAIRTHGQIHVVYAGTGPFAPLAIPILIDFPIGQIQFTLIDIHQEALDCVQNLIDKLGLGPCIRACIQADATEYRHPKGDPIHLAIAETMQNALNQEPQVAVMRNLANQLPIGVPIMPKRVTIHASFSDTNTAHATPVFTLTRHLFHAHESSNRLLAEIVEVPKFDASTQHPRLLTQIQVSNTVSIHDSECDLTVPAPFPEGPSFQPGDHLQFYYEISTYPQLKYRILN